MRDRGSTENRQDTGLSPKSRREGTPGSTGKKRLGVSSL